MSLLTVSMSSTATLLSQVFLLFVFHAVAPA